MSESEPPVQIAVCSDRNIIPGLHVTLSTALRHLAPQRAAVVHLIHHELTPGDLDLVRQTLDLTGRPYQLHTYPVPFDALKGLGGIRGNVMAWARFMIPGLLSDVHHVLYLDSDLVVLTDVSEMFDMDMDGAAVGLVHHENARMRYSLEKGLFQRLGLDLDAPYYNTGVLLMNLDEWRRSIVEEGLSFAREQGGSLPAADQTAVNVVFYDRPVAKMDHHFNVQIYASDRFPSSMEKEGSVIPAIYHFIGAPKPWDFAGEWVHRHRELFQDALSHTALAGWRSYAPPTLQSVKTAARNIKSYLHIYKLRNA